MTGCSAPTSHFALGQRRAVALWRPRAREPRDLQALLVDRRLLQVDVRGDEHGLERRRRRDLVGAHGRFREVLQRGGAVVPLHEVAHERAGILHRMVPFRAGTARHRVEPVAREEHDGDAVHPRVVDRHRAMLEAHGAVDHGAHGLARGLRIAVRHRDGRLLVHAGEELGLRVLPVVDERLVDAAEARARIGRDVLEVERLDDVDHEVGAGTIDDDVAGSGSVLLLPCALLRRRFLLRRFGRLREHRSRRCPRARGRTLQESPPVDRRFLLVFHRRSPSSIARFRITLGFAAGTSFRIEEPPGELRK